MRTLLAIETSGPSLGIALRSDTGLLFEENITAGAIHGRALAPTIQKALQQHGLKPNQLEAVAISVGPGSWTGLRIGISAAKALAWGAGIKLIGVPSFEALARDAAKHSPSHARLTVRDARSEGFFAALFGETSDPAERWIPECVLQPELLIAAVKSDIAAHPGAPLALCGDRVCVEKLRPAAQQNGWLLLETCENISGAAVAEIGWQRLLAGDVCKTTAEIHRLTPLYLRASDPQLKLARRGSQ